MSRNDNLARRSADLVLVVAAALVLTACHDTAVERSSAAPATVSKGLEAIGPADPAKYPKSRDLSNWQNPHLIVRQDGIGVVDLSNHEIHILAPGQVPAALTSLPPDAWPYGRVVLVTEAASKDPTDQTKTDLRKNRGLLAGTLKELGVQMREAP